MTIHGVVIAFLLLFPWGMVGVAIVGATLSGVKRNLGHLQRVGWVRRRRYLSGAAGVEAPRWRLGTALHRNVPDF